ncbi:MAG TPA: nucleotidyltransferase domain-containing protein [Chthonomonadales bacterium]|nr:nucleotidyltransferase domain-containing protein [Chthonomonadales bacterium]
MIRDIEERRAELEALCRRLGVRRLEVFGSAATGEFWQEARDLDFLVEFERPTDPGYADLYFGLLEALEALFGRQVDLVVASAIKNPHFRESISETRTLLYAA